MKNARFWIRWDGDFVKLTLKPGDDVELHCSGSHEEGWWSCYEEYSYHDGVVTRTSIRDGRDCDGRLSDTCILECSVDRLNYLAPYRDEADYCPEPGAKLPDWDEVRSRKRDYYAEAAGY